MFYILYLVGAGILLFIGMTFEWSFGAIVMANLLNFWDIPTLLFILLFCILALFCTKSFRAFGNAFLFACGKKELSQAEAEHALISVKAVMLDSLLSGGLLGIIGLINGGRQLSEPSAIGIIVALAFLAVGYALVICLALLPAAVLLKQSVLSKDKEVHLPHAVAVKPRVHHKSHSDE